eukprot:s436_g48.t1
MSEPWSSMGDSAAPASSGKSCHGKNDSKGKGKFLAMKGEKGMGKGLHLQKGKPVDLPATNLHGKGDVKGFKGAGDPKGSKGTGEVEKVGKGKKGSGKGGWKGVPMEAKGHGAGVVEVKGNGKASKGLRPGTVDGKGSAEKGMVEAKGGEPGSTGNELAATKPAELMGPPPFLFSGYGGMTPDDMEKHPTVVMQEHESKVRTWCKGKPMKDVVRLLKNATGHMYYNKFMSQFKNRSFGANGYEDLVEFDMWLKKYELSEKTGRTKPPTPSPPAKVTVTPTKPTTENSESLPSLTPAEKEKYQEYWKQFTPTGEAAANGTPPTASPSGLRPGLLQKYQNASTSEEKFQLLKAFLLDPVSMSSVTIEARYEEMASHEDKSKWIQVPLATLRRQYTTDAEKRFLHEKILKVQTGENHPQDPMGEDPEMKLYWVFQENSDVNNRRKEVGHRLSATANVPVHNKAARTAVADHVLAKGATFNGKGSAGQSFDMGKGKGKAKAKPAPKKAPKAGVYRTFASSYAKTAEEVERATFKTKMDQSEEEAETRQTVEAAVAGKKRVKKRIMKSAPALQDFTPRLTLRAEFVECGA